ncbi:MAG: hypothetical protein K2Y08_04880 [Alphaproteobacteria bacterium]|nr:hypothetical protein [Alphaproteobacteria bacterium]
MSQKLEINNSMHKLEQCVSLGSLRWLHAIDLDSTSKSFGIADREYWSWKTKDFANATWQGGLAGFLDVHELLNLPKESITKITKANVLGINKLQRRNGSFEEAYPWESSVCVTALVLFNLLYAFYVYPQYFDPHLREVIKSIVKLAFQFLEKTPETHGVIANHEATIVFSKRMARRFLGLTENNEELNHFLSLQHPKENWFPEYGGADPGYQTLLNHYLIAGAYALNELELISSSMKKSLEFVSLFCFPDGTYAGEIGNRGTSIVYPSGFISLEKERNLGSSSETQWFLLKHQETIDAVTPLSVDASNFVPVFNSWAFFSKIGLKNTSFYSVEANIDQQNNFLEDAGILIKKTKKSYIAISFRNACVRKGIQTDDMNWIDKSVVSLTFQDWTTQGIPVENIEHNGSFLTWHYRAIKRKQVFNTPGKLTILRFAGLLVFPFSLFQRLLKRMLVSYIMKSLKSRSTPLVAQIDLSDPLLTLKIINNSNENWEVHSFGFHQHMASANTFVGRCLL